MNVAIEEVMKLQRENRQLFDQDVLNILNGQHMYEEFKAKKLMGKSDYAPFNEAMCVNAATYPLFDEQFIRVRALGHGVTVDAYKEKVIDPLNGLFNSDYRYIVLWFGEDVFCQMNLITVLAYLEEVRYKGRVYLNNFREDEQQVNQMELTLGNFRMIFWNVLIKKEKPSTELLPVMSQAIDLYLMMQSENNEVVNYIKQHPEMSEQQLLKELFQLFSTLGYGDTQYLEIIRKVRG